MRLPATPRSPVPVGHAPRGWSDFVESPLGQLAAFVALAAVALVAVDPTRLGGTTFGFAQVALGFIALGCTAVLAYRDTGRQLS